MRELAVGRSGVRVALVPDPVAESGRVLVKVAFSFISSGTEARNVSTAEMSVVDRVRTHPELLQQLVERVREDGISSTARSVRGKIETDRPLGYSCSGWVADVGPDIRHLGVGQAVACGGAGWAVHGEVVSVPVNLVAPIPDGCDLRQASSVSIGAIALQGVRRAQLAIGETVAVIGLGLLGQLTVQIAIAAGCRVYGLDPDRRRAQLAARLGAHETSSGGTDDAVSMLKRNTGGQGVDVTIITAASASDDIVQTAIESTRPKGKVVIVGDVGMGLRRAPLYEKELDVLISCSYGPGRYDRRYEEDGQDYPFAYVRWTEGRNMSAYLELIADGRISVDPLIEGEFPLDEGAEAYDRLRARVERPLALVFRYPERDRAGSSNATPHQVRLRRPKISERVGVAVVGTGDYANAVLLPNLVGLKDRYQLRAVTARSGRHARAAAERFSAEYATTSFQEVLDDRAVAAVVICTRHDLHAGQVIEALRAGKHVFCEKPLALDEAELASVLEAYDEICTAQAAQTTGMQPVLTVGFNRRFSPAGRRLREALADCAEPAVLSYRVNAGRLPTDHWIYGREGGGRVIGEACHMLDFMQFVLGSEVTEIVGAPAGGSARPEDNFSILLSFKGGSLGVLIYSSEGHAGLGKERVECLRGGRSYSIDDFKRLEGHGTSQGQWRGRVKDKGHVECLGAFADCVRGGGLPIPLEEVENSTRLSFIADRMLRDVGYGG